MVHYWFFQRFYDDIDLGLEVYLRDKLYLRWETRIASECKICFLYDSKIDVLKCINNCLLRKPLFTYNISVQYSEWEHLPYS